MRGGGVRGQSGIMGTLLRFLMLRRFFEQSRRHRRGGWGYGHRRPSYGWGYGARPRRRSNVRVTGCCLPIPLGLAMTAGWLTRLGLTRRS